MERRDLLRAILTCRKLNDIGSSLLDSRLCYPVGLCCTRCPGSAVRVEMVEMERLRVLQTLSDHRRVHHLTQLTITDQSCINCTGGHAKSKLVRDIRGKALTILANMIPRAINLRLIRYVCCFTRRSQNLRQQIGRSRQWQCSRRAAEIQST